MALHDHLSGTARVDTLLTARTHALHAAVAEATSLQAGLWLNGQEKDALRERVVSRAAELERWLLRGDAGEPELFTPKGGLPG